MDYAEYDRVYSSWVLSRMVGKTRFFVSVSGTYTDILERAELYRTEEDAIDCLRGEPSNRFHQKFQPMRYPEIIAKTTERI